MASDFFASTPAKSPLSLNCRRRSHTNPVCSSLGSQPQGASSHLISSFPPSLLSTQRCLPLPPPPLPPFGAPNPSCSQLHCSRWPWNKLQALSPPAPSTLPPRTRPTPPSASLHCCASAFPLPPPSVSQLSYVLASAHAILCQRTQPLPHLPQLWLSPEGPWSWSLPAHTATPVRPPQVGLKWSYLRIRWSLPRAGQGIGLSYSQNISPNESQNVLHTVARSRIFFFFFLLKSKKKWFFNQWFFQKKKSEKAVQNDVLDHSYGMHIILCQTSNLHNIVPTSPTGRRVFLVYTNLSLFPGNNLLGSIPR